MVSGHFPRLLLDVLKTSPKSVLLLGPRQVGKSTLIHELKPELSINLAHEEEYFLFQTQLNELERRVEALRPKSVFIDEIQRIPRLTNSIQAIIDRDRRINFYLTGSSARKLRRGRANLLPGRLLTFQMSPLSLLEIGDRWDEGVSLRFGCLPEVMRLPSEADRKRLLLSYSNTYLKEEIMSEALVRQIDGFLRFFQAAAMESGQFVDFTKLARKARVSRQSVGRHYEVLEDTLVAHRLDNDPELEPDEVDLIKHPRFFFFDLGVVNALRGSFELNQERVGFLFEHLVFHQLVNTCHALNKDWKMFNFRTRGGMEVDFILNLEGRKIAIECKASETVSSSELNSLRALRRYYPKIEKRVFYRGNRELKEDDIWILPLKQGVESLFG